MTEPITLRPPASLAQGRLVYQRLTRRRLVLLAGIAALTVACFVLDLSIGQARYSALQVLSGVWNSDASLAIRVILWDIRLPVALTALVVGASLRSPARTCRRCSATRWPALHPGPVGRGELRRGARADPGVSVLPASAVAFAIPVNAFLVSMAAALFIHHLSRKRGITTEMIVLLGTTLVFTFTALLEALQYVAPDQALSAVVFWTMGSLSRSNWPKLGIMSGVLVLVSLAFARQAWALTALRLGEARATSLGVPVARLRLRGILLASLLASVCVSFVGTIGFVGLVGPHIARMLVGKTSAFAAGLCTVRSIDAVGGLGAEQVAGGRADSAHRHRHLAGGRAAVLHPDTADPPTMTELLNVRDVSAVFGTRTVLQGVSFARCAPAASPPCWAPMPRASPPCYAALPANCTAAVRWRSKARPYRPGHYITPIGLRMCPRTSPPALR